VLDVDGNAAVGLFESASNLGPPNHFAFVADLQADNGFRHHEGMSEHMLVTQTRFFRVDQMVFEYGLATEGEFVNQEAVIGIRLRALLLGTVEKLVRLPG
jgi:hypothetical protein